MNICNKKLENTNSLDKIIKLKEYKMATALGPPDSVQTGPLT